RRQIALGLEAFEVQIDLFVPLLQRFFVQTCGLRVERIDLFVRIRMLFDHRGRRCAGIRALTLVANRRSVRGSRRLRLLAARFACGNDVFARCTAVRAERLALGYAARGTRAIYGHAGSTFACGRFELALAEYEYERSGIEDRVVAAGADTHEQGEREVLQRNAAQRQQRHQRDDDRRQRVERTRHRLQNRRVDDLVVRLARHELRVLADTVENDDRVHDRVTDDGQHGSEERVVGTLAGDGVDADHHRGVAKERNDGNQTEDIVPAEAERDVEELDAERDDERFDRLGQVFTSESRPHRGNLRFGAIHRSGFAERGPQLRRVVAKRRLRFDLIANPAVALLRTHCANGLIRKI